MLVLMKAHLWRYALYRASLNLVSEASRYYLGWLWWLIEPLVMTSIFFFVFTRFRPAGGEGYTNFLIVGVTMWLWFANAVGNATDTLVGARNIITQMRLPKLLFPTIAVVSATLKQAFVFVIVLIVFGIVVGPAFAWFSLPLLAGTQFIFILAVASTVAFVCCWVRDLRFIVRSGLTLMMFCSGIFFSIEDMSALVRLNPMAVLIDQYRHVLLSGGTPDVLWCSQVIGGSVLWLVAMKWVYDRFDLLLTRRVIA